MRMREAIQDLILITMHDKFNESVHRDRSLSSLPLPHSLYRRVGMEMVRFLFLSLSGGAKRRKEPTISCLIIVEILLIVGKQVLII